MCSTVCALQCVLYSVCSAVRAPQLDAPEVERPGPPAPVRVVAQRDAGEEHRRLRTRADVRVERRLDVVQVPAV